MLLIRIVMNSIKNSELWVVCSFGALTFDEWEVKIEWNKFPLSPWRSFLFTWATWLNGTKKHAKRQWAPIVSITMSTSLFLFPRTCLVYGMVFHLFEWHLIMRLLCLFQWQHRAVLFANGDPQWNLFHAHLKVCVGTWVLLCYFPKFSNIYQLDLQNKTHVTLASLWWSINKHGIEIWTSFDLVMVIGNARLLFLGWIHRSSRSCSLWSVGSSQNLKMYFSLF